MEKENQGFVKNFVNGLKKAAIYTALGTAFVVTLMACDLNKTPEPTPAPAPKKAKLTNFYVEGYGNVLGKDFEDACANAEKIKAKIREP